MKTLFLGLAFLLELIAFISFAAIGYVFAIDAVLKVVIFVVLLILLIVFWSLYMAPRAVKKFGIPAYYIAKSIIYLVSAVTLLNTHSIVVGCAFIGASLVDELFLFRHNLEQSSDK